MKLLLLFAAFAGALLAQNPSPCTQIRNAATSGQVLSAATNGRPPQCQWIAAGGGGVPGGSTTQIQYNNAGAFGGMAGSAWNGTTMTVAGNGTPGNTIAHFGVGSPTHNTYQFDAANDFLVNTAGFFINSSNNDAAASSATGLNNFFDNANPNGTMNTIQAASFRVQHSGNGALDTATVLRLGFNTSGTPGAITNVNGLLIENMAGASTNAWAIKTGTGLVDLGDQLIAPLYATTTNCADSAGAAACGAAPAGAFVIDATTTATVVSTTAVTATSRIFLQEDSSLGTELGVTCNTQSSLTLGALRVTARTAATSFTATLEVAPTTNPMCVNYWIVN